MIIMPNSFGAHLNPSAYSRRPGEKGNLETKLIIDATKPLPPASFPEVARAPRDLVARIDVEDFPALVHYVAHRRLGGVPGPQVR